MKCPHCGYQNPEGTLFCTNCGKTVALAQLEPIQDAQTSAPAAQMASEEHARKCVSCGRTIPWDANVCPHCGHDFTAPVYQIPVMSGVGLGLRVLFYIVSALIPIAGIVIGIVYLAKPDPESKRVGKICIAISVIAWALAFVLLMSA